MAAPNPHVLSPEVKKILRDNAELRHDKEKNKIVCCLSGHEMPTNSAGVLQSYVNGKKFRKLQQNLVFDYNKYLPHIIPNPKKKFAHELVCTLTLRHFVRSPENVLRHVKGKRYQRALARWQRCQETGEVFKPFKPRPKLPQAPCPVEQKFGGFADSDSASSSDVDSLSDLYPAADFPEEEDDDEEEEEEDEEVVDGAGDDHVSARNGSSSSKRQHSQLAEDSEEEEEEEEEEEAVASGSHDATGSRPSKAFKKSSRARKKKKLMK